MRLKMKSWVWWLAWPFAHPTSGTYTTIWDTIYCPVGGLSISPRTLKHERIHSEQQHRWGWMLLPAWIFCYLFTLPILVNPFRECWEMEAYVQGSGLTESDARARLRTVTYGWLL